jgi:6-pyruvoyltetrahydropterin/6-carboxytetrahydropterin synthase
MAFSCTRRIQFCAGHRVTGHEGKCAHLHGHNYVAFITAEGGLDRLGRVIDFSVLKGVVGGWIEEHWDHGMILWSGDELARGAMAGMDDDAKVFIMPTIPTAENMAQFLKDRANTLLRDMHVTVTKVVLWETENCYAEV